MAVLLAIIKVNLNPNDLHCPLDYINLQQLSWYLVMFQNLRSIHKINPMLLPTLLLNRCIWLPPFFSPSALQTDMEAFCLQSKNVFPGEGTSIEVQWLSFLQGQGSMDVSVLWWGASLGFYSAQSSPLPWAMPLVSDHPF